MKLQVTPSHGLGYTLSPRIIHFTLLLSLLATLPHTLHLPVPVTLYFIAIVLWQLFRLHHAPYVPGRLWLILLTLGGVVLVYNQHQTLLGRDAGVSLLTVMLVLKLMELRERRDIYVVVFISYFIVITQFLFSQAFLLALYLLALVLCLTALLLEINRVNPSKTLLEPLRRTLIISLQALPIAVILFILFPRLSHPIWQFGLDAGSGTTGLDDRVSPGSISQLIRSSAVAFRVQFHGQPPAPERRYWRGLVLWDTDGFDWFNRQAKNLAARPLELAEINEPVEYEIYLEPHHKRWLFTLDLPVIAPANTHLSRDYQLSSANPVNRPHRYTLTSYMQYRTVSPESSVLQQAVALPDNVTQRERDLVNRWKASANTDLQLVKLALEHFNTQPFVYTLTPPLYLTNPADQFLFEGQEGFCEHFASSFVLLMRLAGIPSRLVVGYQGGEFNPVGDYFILRQSDAHAWAEVWLNNQGWTRIDPTAAVAPERVRHGIQPEFGVMGSPVLFNIADDSLLRSAARQMGLVFDAANISWRRWVLGYGRERQSHLLRKFGIDLNRAWEWTGLLFSLVGLSLLAIYIRISLMGRRRMDPVLKTYNKLCRKLAGIGLARMPHEGPLDYSRRVAKQRQDLMPQTCRMFGLYIRLRYGRLASKQAAAEFQAQVRQFRPGKAPFQLLSR